MNSVYLPTTREISEMVTAEVVAAGGAVSDRHEDGRRLFLRSVLPAVRRCRRRRRPGRRGRHGGR